MLGKEGDRGGAPQKGKSAVEQRMGRSPRKYSKRGG